MTSNDKKWDKTGFRYDRSFVTQKLKMEISKMELEFSQFSGLKILHVAFYQLTVFIHIVRQMTGRDYYS